MAGEPPTGATPEAGVTRWRENRNEMLSMSQHFHSSASIHHFNSVAGKRMTALAKLGYLNLTVPLWGSLLHWGRNFLLTSAPLGYVLVKHLCPALWEFSPPVMLSSDPLALTSLQKRPKPWVAVLLWDWDPQELHITSYPTSWGRFVHWVWFWPGKESQWCQGCRMLERNGRLGVCTNQGEACRIWVVTYPEAFLLNWTCSMS